MCNVRLVAYMSIIRESFGVGWGGCGGGGCMLTNYLHFYDQDFTMHLYDAVNFDNIQGREGNSEAMI